LSVCRIFEFDFEYVSLFGYSSLMNKINFWYDHGTVGETSV